MDEPIKIHKCDVMETLSFIENLSLPQPGGALLTSFVVEAMSREVAAGFIREKATSKEEALKVVADWICAVESITVHGNAPKPLDAATSRAIIQRDGAKCCVTGRSGGFFDPLIVVSVLPIPSNWLRDQNVPAIRSFLWDTLQKLVARLCQESYATSPFQNHWLARKSVSEALRMGQVKLVRLPSSPFEFEVSDVSIAAEEQVKINGQYALLGDHSRTGVEKVDPCFVGSHGRFCRSIQLVAIARDIAPQLFSREPKLTDDPPHAKPFTVPATFPAYFHVPRRAAFSLQRAFGYTFLTIWKLFPNRIRMYAYEVLLRFGRHWHGLQSRTPNVQRLPFGLFLKCGADSLRNEYNSLKMIRKHTSIPGPEPLDFVQRPPSTDEPASIEKGYLLMTRVPGIPLSQSHDALSDADCANITLQMRDYASLLRDLPRRVVSPDTTICNTLGEGCQDLRLRGGTSVGPFENEAEFNQMLRYPDDPARQGHRIVFTHADLNPRNILVQQVTGETGGRRYWRVSGIVDWETAGYYPEYWEYTKAMFERYRWPRRYNSLIKDVFGLLGDYSRELDLEIRSWESGDAV